MARIIAERADIIPLLGEVFRAHGYEGASLSVIAEATGLGKGSLYHFFPGGKEEMAAAVLSDIKAWFETKVYAPLRNAEDPRQAILDMFASVEKYFESGGRICLVGLFALGEERDRFTVDVQRYFVAWIEALSGALRRMGYSTKESASLAQEAVATIQGGLVLERAIGQGNPFVNCLRALERRLGSRGT